jgi:type VI secretion system secreted protein VgrG
MPQRPTQSDGAGMVEDAFNGLGEAQHVQYSFSTSATVDAGFHVLSVSLEEAISGTYSARITLNTGEDWVKADDLRGRSASLTIHRSSQARTLHGIVERVLRGRRRNHEHFLTVTLVPALAMFRHMITSRTFLGKTVPEIVKEVLEQPLKERFGRALVLDFDHREFPQREYVVQYQESDYAFVTRLLADEGIWFYFREPSDGGDGEELVLTNAKEKAQSIAEDPALLLADDRETGTGQEHVSAFVPEDSTTSTSMHVRHYNYTHSDVPEEVTEKARDGSGLELPAYEFGGVHGTDYGAREYRKHDTDTQARHRLQALRASQRRFSGRSNAILLRTGHVIELDGHRYLVVSARHDGSTEAGAEQSAHFGTYGNSFTCIPAEVDYRPARQKKPSIPGYVSAIVADRSGKTKIPTSSEDGEDIVTDEYGRVFVKFPWDLTPADGTGMKSCPVRVAQLWAGRRWGTQFIPRVGMEVMVAFEGGDPDRPAIHGCLPNMPNEPPYAGKPTQSGIKTASSVDPSRYNEIRFEDAKDQEQIFVRAQKDFVEEVLNDHTTTVSANQKQVVKKSQAETVNGNASLTVGGKRTKTVGGDKEHGEEITVKGERKTTVTKKHTEAFLDEHEVTVTKKAAEIYNDEHSRVVKGPQNFQLETDRIETIKGEYQLTTDKALRITQGNTTLVLEGNSVALNTPGPFTVDVNGGASVSIDGQGNVALKGNTSISFEVGGNKITISMSGIEIAGTQVAVAAGPGSLELGPAGTSLKGAMTTVEGEAVCAVKGGLLNLN